MTIIEQAKTLLLTQQNCLTEVANDAELISCLCGKKIHYFDIKGNKKRGMYYSSTQLPNLLDELGIKYTVENDAPRGGKCGNYIELKGQLKKRQKIVATLKENGGLFTKRQKDFQSKLNTEYYSSVEREVNLFLSK